MCFPPEISVPAFARVRDWRGEERGSKPWRPSYVLRESAENWSALDASGAQVDASPCDRAASRCATGINLPLQALHVASTAYENTNAFDPEHPSTPPRYAKPLLLQFQGALILDFAVLFPSRLDIRGSMFSFASRNASAGRVYSYTVCDHAIPVETHHGQKHDLMNMGRGSCDFGFFMMMQLVSQMPETIVAHIKAL